MKYIASFLFLFCFQRTFSQEIKVLMEYGFAIGEMKAFKKSMLHTGVRAGMEFTIKRDLSLVISAGGSLLRFSYNTTASESVFDRKYFFTMPVSVKKYYPFSRKSGGFLDFGGCFNYLVSDKKETRNGITTTSTTQKGAGYNMGIHTFIGFRTLVTPSLAFETSIGGGSDLSANYKQDIEKIKANRTSLSISFSRKF